MTERFDQWAILELMGHRRLAGRVSEAQIAGAPFLRLDVPCDPPTTQFYAPGAVYAITPTSEEVCRAFARRSAPIPVQRWELLELEAPPAPDATENNGEPW